MFLTENCRVIQSLTFRLRISYVIKARAKQKDSHIHRTETQMSERLGSLSMFRADVYTSLKTQKVTAYEKQMLCGAVFQATG